MHVRMHVRVHVRMQIFGLMCVFVYETRERGTGDGCSRFVRLQGSSAQKVGSSEAACREWSGAAGQLPGACACILLPAFLYPEKSCLLVLLEANQVEVNTFLRIKLQHARIECK